MTPRWVNPDPAPLLRPDPIHIPEADARTVLAAVLDSLRWAHDYRARAHAQGPTDGAPGERWAWYQQGASAATIHDRHCVEEELRRVLHLPDGERDTTSLGDTR